jgi:hypothetical protein
MDKGDIANPTQTQLRLKKNYMIFENKLGISQ